MPTVAVVYHSEYGHTRVVAESIVEGVRAVDGADAEILNIDEFPPADPGGSLIGPWKILANADAVIFGCPTYMGSITAKMKAFMEASGPAWGTQAWKDKLAAGFTNAGGLSGDKVNALIDIAMFACQHSMIWVSQGVFYDDTGINRMSSWIGMQAQSDNAPPETTPPPEDRRTAELFGQRVARATLRWARGAL